MGQGESALPFHIGNEVVNSWTGTTAWKLFNGKAKDDGSEVSIFAFDKKTTQDPSKLTAAQNYLQRLRTTRHPHVLKFINGVELPTMVYIVTEPVTPLDLSNIDPKSGDGAVVLGLRQLTTAIAFLNNECKLVHANVSPTSIFVTAAGDWKIGGFDIAFSYGEEVAANTKQNADLCPQLYRSPEYMKRSWSVMERAPSWATDAWSLGCLIYAIFNGQYTQQKQLGSPGAIPRPLLEVYGKLLSVDAQARLNPAKVLESKFFEHDLVTTVEFLDTLPIRTDEEKQAFFSSFALKLDRLPQQYLKYRILPELTKSLEFGAALSSFASVLESGSRAKPCSGGIL